MTKEQIDALRENACGCPCHTEPHGFCLECCGPGKAVLARLLDEREALLRVVPRLLAFVTGDGLREMVEHEIVFGAPPLVSTTETQAWFDATEARVADEARKAIALAEAP